MELIHQNDFEDTMLLWHNDDPLWNKLWNPNDDNHHYHATRICPQTSEAELQAKLFWTTYNVLGDNVLYEAQKIAVLYGDTWPLFCQRQDLWCEQSSHQPICDGCLRRSFWRENNQHLQRRYVVTISGVYRHDASSCWLLSAWSVVICPVACGICVPSTAVSSFGR